MQPRIRIMVISERAQGILIGALPLTAALGFGGAVWWFAPARAVMTVLLLVAALLGIAARGRLEVLRSPATALGVLALGLALIQQVPWPWQAAQGLSPRARAIHALGVVPERIMAVDPEQVIPEAGSMRTTATLDRSATLRWLAGALSCLVLFWSTGQHTDRLMRTRLVWGVVVGVLFLGTAFGVVQIVGHTTKLYGLVAAGEGPAWAPTAADLMTLPGRIEPTRLKRPNIEGDVQILSARPTSAIAGWSAGAGAYLAIAALGLPLALGLCLHGLAPRGRRESLYRHVTETSEGGMACLVYALALASAVLVGVLAGPWLAIPFAAGLAITGLAGSWSSEQPRVGTLASLLLLAALAGGVWIAGVNGPQPGSSPLASPDVAAWSTMKGLWSSACRIGADYPLVGTGMGSYPTIAPFYQATGTAWNTPWSTLLRYGVESGLIGVMIAAMGGLWVLARLPRAVLQVRRADRMLAWGLVGTGVAFLGFSALHWTAELPAVALAASAVAGTANRWLAGGTDLFVEPL